jgi:hypothetical protein
MSALPAAQERQFPAIPAVVAADLVRQPLPATPEAARLEERVPLKAAQEAATTKMGTPELPREQEAAVRAARPAIRAN